MRKAASIFPCVLPTLPAGFLPHSTMIFSLLIHNENSYPMTKILFVCLGNICRSSAAEEVFRTLVHKRGLSDRFSVDSAGIIDYHEGELSDPRMIRHAGHRGYRLTHRSRPVRPDDFVGFDYIVGMDEDNLRALRRKADTAPRATAVFLRMADYLSRHADTKIPDPYYGNADDFEHVLDLLEDASEGLLAELAQS